MLNRRHAIIALFTLFLATFAVRAADAPELAALLRGFALENLPDPLHRDERDWGKTKDVKVVKFHRGKPRNEKVPKNDGLWKRVRVEALNPRESLSLELRDLRTVGATTTFTLALAADVRIEAEQQQWENGIKLYGASVRARARVGATLKCEVSNKTEFRGGLPELIFTLRVTEATSSYDNLHVEHVAGLGGDAAKIIGKTSVDLIHQWKPSLERKLLEKANRAVVKAGDNKQVPVRGLGKWVK